MDNIEIAAFFETIKKQNENDQQKTLKLLIEKHIHANEAKLMLDYYDLLDIIAFAKAEMSRKVLPITLGEDKKEVPQIHNANFIIIEATINILNKLGAFKRVPEFRYTVNTGFDAEEE